MQFYKRDPDRAIAGMAELTFEERGAYNSLLDLLYSRDGNVPDDDVRVARMMSCHWRQWAKLKKRLIDAGKVWVEDGYLCAKRVQETIREAADFSQRQRRIVAKRWVKAEKPNGNNDPPIPPGNTLTATATATSSVEPNGSTVAAATLDVDAIYYQEGRRILGKRSGALLTKLKRAKGSPEAALKVLEVAQRKADPAAYVGAASKEPADDDQELAEIIQREMYR